MNIIKMLLHPMPSFRRTPFYIFESVPAESLCVYPATCLSSIWESKCCLHFTWSKMLLVLWLVVPISRAGAKVHVYWMRLSNCSHTLQYKNATNGQFVGSFSCISQPEETLALTIELTSPFLKGWYTHICHLTFFTIGWFPVGKPHCWLAILPYITKNMWLFTILPWNWPMFDCNN